VKIEKFRKALSIKRGSMKFAGFFPVFED
jgi:hypothetical protein